MRLNRDNKINVFQHLVLEETKKRRNELKDIILVKEQEKFIQYYPLQYRTVSIATPTFWLPFLESIIHSGILSDIDNMPIQNSNRPKHAYCLYTVCTVLHR